METSIITKSGAVIDYINPDPEQIRLEDIAYSLSHEPRYLGRGNCNFTVAEHLLYCLEIAKELRLSPYLQLRVLMHDFAEAYIKDIPTPLKHCLKDYKEIENKFEKAIADRYELRELSQHEKDRIKLVDWIALREESEYLDIEVDNTHGFLTDLHEVEVKPISYSPTTSRALIKKSFAECWKNAFQAEPHTPYIIIQEEC